MPRTPNREQGQLVVDSIVLTPPDASYGPQQPGELRLIDGRAIMKDALGDFDVRYGTLPADQHEALDTLTHEIAENNYTEIGRTNGRVTSVVIWETAQKLRKIRETQVTRTGGLVMSSVVTQYDAQGAVKDVLTSEVTRNGNGQITSLATVKS